MALVLGIALALLVRLAWSVLLGPEGHHFDSAGVRIHYTDEGRGAPVLLVHGFGMVANLEWRRPGLIVALSKEYRVIALDARGHGRSGKPHDPNQYGVQMVEDLVRLMDHLNIEKAHVVGYSMGGFIILKMVAMHPERLLSAVPCAAGWEQATQENLDFAEAVAKAVEKGDAGPLLKRLDRDHIDRPFKWWERLGTKMGLTYFNDALALAAVARVSLQLTLTDKELRSNKVPTLTIIGSEDGLLPDAKALAEQMANHELVILEGGNHGSTKGSIPFLTALRAFLAEHTPSTAKKDS
jgi:pimeloyl-ACP methyl ester carboxylesterase